MKKVFSLFLTLLMLSAVVPVHTHAVSAQAAILLHPETGTVLFERNADQRMLIASTTKVMTALVVLENCDPDEEVVVTAEQSAVEGSSMYLRAGERYTVCDLLYGLMLVSGNDAALALAQHTAGSQEAFAELMNEKAAELSLQNTSFENPHGLDAENHYSSARDLAVIMAEAMKNADFRKITGARYYNCHGLTYANHNKLLASVKGVVGGKTGYTKAAGRSLVTAFEQDGLSLICVTLNDPDDWRDHESLYREAAGTYDYLTLGDLTFPAVRVVSGISPSVRTVPAFDTGVLVKKTDQPSISVHLPHFIFAPMDKGDILGRAQLLVNGEVMGEVNLVCAENVQLAVGLEPGGRRFIFRSAMGAGDALPVIL